MFSFLLEVVVVESKVVVAAEAVDTSVGAEALCEGIPSKDTIAVPIA